MRKYPKLGNLCERNIQYKHCAGFGFVAPIRVKNLKITKIVLDHSVENEPLIIPKVSLETLVFFSLKLFGNHL